MKPLLAVLPAALVIAAGCGGSSSSSTPVNATRPAAKPDIATATTSLGKVLVDGQGRTLYRFEKDHGAASSCYGACASAWPPLTSPGKAAAASGVTASELGASPRKDGDAGVTYFGHPLYTFAGDRKPGDVKGQEVDAFGGEWYALSPTGKTIEGD